MWVLDILHFLFWIGWVISFLSNKIRKCFCLRKSPFSIMAISLFFFFFVSLVYVMVGFKKDHMKILVNSQGLVRFSRECQNPKMKKARLIKKEMWMNQEMLRRVSMRRKAVFQGWKWIKMVEWLHCGCIGGSFRSLCNIQRFFFLDMIGEVLVLDIKYK